MTITIGGLTTASTPLDAADLFAVEQGGSTNNATLQELADGLTSLLSLDIDDLGDVDTTTTPPSTGDRLQFNGTLWVPVGGDIGELSDVDTDTTAPVERDLLEFDGTDWVPVPQPYQILGIAASDETSDLATGTGVVRLHMFFSRGTNIIEARAGVSTAPTGSSIIVDVNSGGASILSTRITIAAGSLSDDGTSAVSSPGSTYAPGSSVTIDIDQVGSNTPGAGLKVYLLVRESNQ